MHTRQPGSGRHVGSLGILVWLTWLLWSGCGEDLGSAWELGDLPQILVIRATPPEVAPGDTVMLDALVHSPAGPSTLHWMVCVPDIGDELLSCMRNHATASAPPRCADAPTARLCIAGIGPTATFTVPTDVLPPDGGSLTIFANLLVTPSPDGLAGCDETLSGGPPTYDCLLALKRVVVSNADHSNVNPVITGLALAAETTDPSAIHEIDPGTTDLEDLQLEVGVIVDATSLDEVFPPDGVAVPASLVVSWFTTCGELDGGLTFLDVTPTGPGQLDYDLGLVTWKPKQSGDCTLHAVIRDDRGGAGYLTQHVQIATP